MTEWDRILPEKEYSLEESDEPIVDFADSLRARDTGRILDLACGAGRHVAYMTRRGFEVIGVDVSEIGLKMTRNRLKERAFTAVLVKSTMVRLPFVDSSFDAVTCTRAIYHQRLLGIHETLVEIRKVLRRNGAVLIDFLSKRTYSYGKGIVIEKETFIETEGDERGIIHHISDEEELQRLFGGFQNTYFDLCERIVEGKLRSCLIVRAIK